MKAKDDSPADIVFGTVLGIANDMARGVAYVVRGMADYTSIFAGMNQGFAEIRKNLEHHILKHSWTSKRERARVKIMVAQIALLEEECKCLSVLCEGFVAYMVGGLNKLEKDPIMAEIFSKIEAPVAEEDTVDDRPEDGDE